MTILNLPNLKKKKKKKFTEKVCKRKNTKTIYVAKWFYICKYTSVKIY